MAQHPVETVLRTIGRAQPSMRARYGPNGCVVCTRIVVETLRRNGIRAQPLPVSVTVYNPVMTGYLEGNDSVSAERDPQACQGMFGFTGSAPPGMWDGHLVCIVQGRTLVDLTLDQVNQWGNGFAVTPARLPVPADFVRGGSVSFTNQGCLVQYDARPDEKSYLTLEDWNDRSEWEPLIRHIEQLLRTGRSN